MKWYSRNLAPLRIGSAWRGERKRIRTSDADVTLGLNLPTDNNQQVTVRRLPDGDLHAALLHGSDQLLLRIDLRPEAAGAGVNKGDLVEVNCPQTLYLGEVRARQGQSLVIGIEHALDRSALASIQQVWHVPADE